MPPFPFRRPENHPLFGPLLSFAAALLVLLPGLDGRRCYTYHEAVFVQPAREMLATGEFLVPTFGGVTWGDKPPLTHWLLAASFALLGHSSEFAGRLPLALCGAAAAAVVAAVARLGWGPRVGVLAGLVQATAFYVLMQARLAEPDMLLCLCVLCGNAVVFASILKHEADGGEQRHPYSRPAVRGAAFFAALAVLTKGPLGGYFVLAPLTVWTLLPCRRVKVGRLFDPLALLIFFGPTAGWAWAASTHRPDIADGWLKHNLDRFTGGLGASEPWPFYLYAVPALLLPWSLFAPLALLGTRPRRWWGDSPPAIRFMILWVGLGLALLSASAWKHKHYALPILPPLSILAALGLARHLRWPARWWNHPLPSAGLAVAGGLGAAAWLLATPTLPPVVQDARPDLCGALAVAAAGLTAAALLRAPRPRWAAVALVGTVGVVGAWAGLRVTPRFDGYRDQVHFAEVVRRAVPPGETVHMVQLPENQIAVYLGRPFRRTDRPDDFLRLDTAGPRHLLLPLSLAERWRSEHGMMVLAATDRERPLPTAGRDRLALARWDGPTARIARR